MNRRPGTEVLVDQTDGPPMTAVVRRCDADALILTLLPPATLGDIPNATEVTIIARTRSGVHRLAGRIDALSSWHTHLVVAHDGVHQSVQRRAFARAPVQLDAHVSYAGRGSGRRIHTVTQDISGGGVSLERRERLAIGQVLRVEIALTGEMAGRTVSGEGQIVRSAPDGSGVGMRFSRIAPADRDGLVRMVFEHERGELARLQATADRLGAVG